MNTSFLALGCLGLVAAGLAPTVRADQYVNISVKVICRPDGTRPLGGLADLIGFQAEVNHGNAATIPGFGYRLRIVEFTHIAPPPMEGTGSNYWFATPARSEVARDNVYNAATSDPVTWRWTEKAINFYINDTSSGICSFPANERPIVLLGKSGSKGVVVHEIGHIFNLTHTHPGDQDSMVNNWGDGDGLPETLPDDPDATLFDINARYPNESEQKRLDVFHNVMSYHESDRLLPAQIRVWDTAATHYNHLREVLSPVTVYVGTIGNDTFGDGSSGSPYRTVTRASQSLDAQRAPFWTIYLMGASGSTTTYSAGSRFAAACRLESIIGPVRLEP